MSSISGGRREGAFERGKGITLQLARHAASLRYEAPPLNP